MICLKIRTFVVSATTSLIKAVNDIALWFAWKFVPLWYQQQRIFLSTSSSTCCDLLENSYLCGISNNYLPDYKYHLAVVICLKIRTFVVSATTTSSFIRRVWRLWFAWKFVPLWYQQQLRIHTMLSISVVICLKIRTFVVSATTSDDISPTPARCDLLENSYLCGISNNQN